MHAYISAIFIIETLNNIIGIVDVDRYIHNICLFFSENTMASRQVGANKFGSKQCETLYKKCYRMTFRWEEIIGQNLEEYVDLTRVAFNSPITLAISALIPMTAAMCGPNTRVNAINYSMPLNTYTMAVCTPGGGKSAVFKHFVCDPADQVTNEYGVNVLLENYSSAGLHRHHIDNKSYALVSSDEGHRLMSNISNKESRNESERSLLNKLWNGKGDKTSLRDAERGFSNTSFSMAISIQPQPLINELVNLGCESDGFYDRCLILVDKPKIHVATEQREAFERLQQSFGPYFICNMFSSIFDAHQARPMTYNLSTDAQTVYDNLVDEHVAEFNSRYNTASGEYKKQSSLNYTNMVKVSITYVWLFNLFLALCQYKYWLIVIMQYMLSYKGNLFRIYMNGFNDLLISIALYNYTI